MDSLHQSADGSERLHNNREPATPESFREGRFDSVIRLAKAVFGTEYVLISLADERQRTFLSEQALTSPETQRAIALCRQTIQIQDALWLDDALADERFRNNPLVFEEPNFRFFAGYPLRNQQGNQLGTLCLIDRSPRKEDSTAVERLRDIANLAEGVLHLIEGEAAREVVDQELSTARDDIPHLIQERRQERVNQIKEASETKGVTGLANAFIEHSSRRKMGGSSFTGEHADGGAPQCHWTTSVKNLVLTETAKELQQLQGQHGPTGRVGTGEFLLILQSITDDRILESIELLKSNIERNPMLKALDVQIKFGWTQTTGQSSDANEEFLLSRALQKLHIKRKGAFVPSTPTK